MDISILKRFTNSLTVKLGSIAILSLLLLVPAGFVMSLIYERQARSQESINEVSSKWGREQLISGPVVTVPVVTTHKNNKGKVYTTTQQLTVLPDDLHITGVIEPKIRYRGIYKILLYTVKLNIKGSFEKLKERVSKISSGKIIWDNAEVIIGISDIKGLTDEVAITLDNNALKLSPGAAVPNIAERGLSTNIAHSITNDKNVFDITINLNGTRSLSFLPLGSSTDVSLKSTWHAPSFNGDFLPTSRSISKDGFSSKWHISEFNRDYPQILQTPPKQIKSSAFGVQLFMGSDIYKLSLRTVKYAILFIIFTFVAIFLGEFINKTKIHIFQYLLTGCAISLFYLLLLSFAEHLNFDVAYGISAFSVIAMIFLYLKSAFRTIVMPIVILAIQITLYLYFFITLKSEDYALLLGSLGIFTLLGSVMYITRKIGSEN